MTVCVPDGLDEPYAGYPKIAAFDDPRVEALLSARGSKYGKSFDELAAIIQAIKLAMKNGSNWDALTVDKKEALELVATKIGRIVYGDPEYDDNWRDIMGYCKLILDTLESK